MVKQQEIRDVSYSIADMHYAHKRNSFRDNSTLITDNVYHRSIRILRFLKIFRNYEF